MDRGMYASASNGLTNLRKLEIVNNNLANINTPGFKREIIVTDEQKFEDTFAKAFEKTDPFARGDHLRAPGAVNIRAVTDFTPGAIKSTGNPLHAALRNPNQFFVINTPEGDQYTRAGDFTLSGEGQVVTPDGYTVSGDGGAIATEGPGIHIAAGGAVRGNGQDFGRLKVVEIKDTQKLERMGGNRFKLLAGGAGPVDVDADIEPGSLEMANVSAVSSMVEMMAANRGFEMYTRTAQSIDQLNQAAISQVGKSK